MACLVCWLLVGGLRLLCVIWCAQCGLLSFVDCVACCVLVVVCMSVNVWCLVCALCCMLFVVRCSVCVDVFVGWW